MEKITCKAFKELLWKNKTVFCGSIFRTTDEKIIAGIENIPAEAIVNGHHREVIHQQTNAVKFEGGSWLYFNSGNEYFRYTSKVGNTFLIRRETYENAHNYIVYAY